MARSQEIIARQNDTLDLICFRVYGDTDMLDQVIKANPALSKHGPVLPMGTRVVLPPRITTPTTKQTVNLWD